MAAPNMADIFQPPRWPPYFSLPPPRWPLPSWPPYSHPQDGYHLSAFNKSAPKMSAIFSRPRWPPSTWLPSPPPPPPRWLPPTCCHILSSHLQRGCHLFSCKMTAPNRATVFPPHSPLPRGHPQHGCYSPTPKMAAIFQPPIHKLATPNMATIVPRSTWPPSSCPQDGRPQDGRP